MTHQVRGQTQSSELSDAVLCWFGLLLSCCTGLDGDNKYIKLTDLLSAHLHHLTCDKRRHKQELRSKCKKQTEHGVLLP